MLGNFVVETTTNPSNSATINLNGPITGRVGFADFITSGDLAFYFLTNGTQWECGHGAFTNAATDTLARTTVLSNSSNNTSRITFTAGLVYVLSDLPAENRVYIHPTTGIELAGVVHGVTSFNAGSASGLRNAIINGRMEIAQRGVSLTTPASNSYLLDRWRINYNGSGSAFTVTQEAVTDSTLLDAGIRNSMKITRGTAGTGGSFRQLQQRIEGVHHFSGREVNISFYAKADSSRTLTLLLSQNFGTGGSPSSTVNSSSSNINVTSSWQRFTFTKTLAGIGGKTFGSDNNDHIIFTINLPLNATDTFEITDVCIQDGAVDLLPERRPKGLELLLCQRYYTRIPIGLTGGSSSTTACTVGGRLPVAMRTEPTITWSGTVTMNFPGDGNYTSTTAPTIANYDDQTGGLTLNWTGFTGLTTFRPCLLNDIGSTDVASLDAEL